MSWVSLRASIPKNEIGDALARVLGAIDKTAILDEAGAIALYNIKRRFLEETDPDGKAWAPLAPRTRKERQRLGYPAAHPIMFRTGRLYHGIQLAKTGPDEREIQSDDERIVPLQYGVNTRNLPPRIMLGFGAEDETAIDRLLLKRFAGALK